MPDKKYLIEIPGMPEGSGVWDADKWERNKDIFMEDYPDANVFELGEYDAEDAKETDQIMLDLGIEEMSGTWDNAKWERNKDVFMQDHPEAKVSRVRYVDYWGQKAEQNRAQKALLQQPNEERNAKLAELGYYDDITGGQVDFSFNAPSVIGLKPLSSAVETTATGETTYLDPRVKEFFANDTAETDRQAEMARLDAEYDANPSVIAQREWEAQMLAERKAYAGKLEEQIKKDMESEVDAKHAGLGAAAKYSNDPYGANQMTQAIRMIKGEDVSKDVTELEKQERYTSALKFLEKAKIARDVAGKGMGGAIIDWAKEGFMDAGTQSDIEAYNEIGDILTRLEKELGNLKEENLSEEVFDKYLTKDEQALIKAFYEYNLAMAEAQQDMSRAYKGGKIFAASIPFMLEFLVTGGVYRAAGRAATTGLGKHFAKWIAKTAAKTFARKAAVATTKVVSGAIKAGVGTLARTVASPGTYKRMAEASIEIDKEGHLNRAKDSAVAFADMYVENLSEISGDLIGGMAKLFGKGVGYLAKGTGKLLDKGASKWLGKTPFATLGNAIGDNVRMQQLAKAWGSFTEKLKVLGFHGLPEEIGEEYIGNAIREIAHIQPGALKEMTEDDNFGAMLIGFAPMTLLGVAGGAISLGVVNAKAAKMGKDLREMFGNTYSAAELDHMMGVIQNAQTAEEIQRALKPYAMAVANAEADGKISADEAAEQIEMLYQYGGFMAQYNTLLFGKKAQDRQMMDAKREEFTNQYGRFWQEDQNETVQIATLNNGSTVFVTSAPAADGMIAIVDAMTGKKGFANVSDILTQEVEGEEVKASNSMTMDAFLNSHIATQRKTAEETRMNNERNAQIEALAAQITPGTRINVGAEGSPVYVFAKRTNKNGVVVVDETGMESMLGWEQAADFLGKPIIVETDQQKLDAEISARLQRLAERHARRKPSPAVQATEEAAEGAADAVAQEQTHIPLNEDGTVNEAAFWTQDPEGYVKWNDEQNKDGGQDSLRQITISKQELIKMLNEVAAGQNTSNPTMRKAAEKQVAAIAEKIAKLQALEMSYADALAEEKEAIKQTQATPTATMSEEDLVKMDEQYQSILGKTRIQSERVRVMQEYLDKLAENSAPIRVLTKDNYGEVMRAEGCPEDDIKRVDEALNRKRGGQVAGFASNGVTFVMANTIADINSARITYIHERQHLLNSQNPEVVKQFAAALGDKENALRILETFVDKNGLEEYKNDSIEKLADEIICRSMEIVYSTENYSVDLQNQGLSEEAINIINTIDNGQRTDKSLSSARRSSYVNGSRRENIEENGRNSEQISGGILGEQEAGSLGSSGRGDGLRGQGSTGEGAEVISEEQLDAPYSGDPSQITAADGEVVADTNGKGGARFSIRTWREGGRDYLAAWLDNDKTLTDEEKADILARMDEFYENAQKYTDTYTPFGTWSEAAVRYDNNGNPLMSVIKANGDYAMNLDFSLVCKKRRPLNRLLRTLINRNAFGTYSLKEREIAEINWILQEHGFEVACALCFVDSKRYRVTGVADVFAALYNKLVKTLAPAGAPIAHFNYSNNPNVEVIENGIDTLTDDQLNWEAFERYAAGFKEGSVESKVAQLLRDNPSQRRLVDATDFIEAEGFEAVKANNQELLKLYNSKKGTGGPKASFGDVQYLNDILKKEKNFDVAKAYAVGGVRIQSFSDFVPHMYFDYMQLFAELAAKKLPAHAYTKEVLFAKIFGLTGLKINLSLVPAVVEGGVAPGLDAEGNYAWADAVRDTDGNIIQQAQSFPFDEAMAIQNAEGYSKNCGAIAVGISDEHIEKMLDDPNIQFIIPYHKSSLNAIVARMTNIDQYKDYTNVQTTKKASGTKLDKGTKDFNFNEYLHNLGENGTPQQAAQAYLDWCKENNFRPKFSQFAYHPNYYKLLVDFNTVDTTTGQYTPQGAVTMTFPTEQNAFGNVETLIEQGLGEDAQLEEKMEAEIDQIADEVESRLAEIAKEPKLSKKQQLKRMAELADERAAQIKARAEGTIDLVAEAEKAYENDVMMRVIGEVGAQRMDAAVEATTLMDNLAIAREMEEAGKDAKTIKMATGWERGADNKWRLEMEDFEFKAKPGKKKTFKLGDLIADEALFAAYPELRNIKVKFAKLSMGTYGQVTEEKGERVIKISEQLYREKNPVLVQISSEFEEKYPEIAKTVTLKGSSALNEEDRQIYIEQLKKPFMEQPFFIDEFGGKPTLVHEIQHIIQAEEGFALGGNESMIDTTNPQVREDVEQLTKVLEIEAQNANDLVEPLKELYRAWQVARLIGTNADVKDALKEYNKLRSEYDKHVSNVNAIRKDLRRFRKLGQSGYERLAGEVEARNVARRIDMSVEERRNALLEETEDVARKDQIFLRDNVMMKADEYNETSVSFRFVPRTDEQRAQLFDAAKTKYGTTNNFNATGYMLPDGSLLDFSEANDGGDPNQRSLDHRDIEGIIMDEGREYDSRYHYVVDFVGEGAIRMLPEAAGFQLSVPPTKEQRSRLMDYFYKHNGEVIMEITDQNGSPRVYMEYNKRTSPSRIFKDMDEFFNNGTTPGLPPLRFRVLDTSKAELKEKPIKLNGMYRFNLKNAFKGVKDNGGSYPYIKVQLEEVSDDYSGEKIAYNGILEGFAVVRIPKGLITEGEKENEFFIDPKAIENELWDVLRATENYYEFKHGGAPYQRDWMNAEEVRFRMSNENQAIFVSNASKAVEAIKMEKATPEQWLKMIEKNGGLKAGEDKWMGLSDWLKASDKKTLTKQEVLDFINENMIRIEEQHYGEIDEEEATRKAIMNDVARGYSLEELQEMVDENAESASRYDDEAEDEDFNLDSWLMDRMVDEFGDDFSAFFTISGGYIEQTDPHWWERDEDAEVLEDESGVRQIHAIRADYTTSGLKNNHEIALTIPTIEPWNVNDNIHFGDAGEGRAIAWIRFGETKRQSPEVKERIAEFDVVMKEMMDKYGYDYESSLTGDDLIRHNTAKRNYFETLKQHPSKKVLVIDEIQSKRHQEGREKGYARMTTDQFIDSMNEKYGTKYYGWQDKATPEELEEYRSFIKSVPDAPFDKNWHELAMKRMLRYAAENGFDVVAWTKGDQQARRYDLSRDVKRISVSVGNDGSRIVNVYYRDEYDDYKNMLVDSEGKVTSGDYQGNALADVVGKEMALQIMNATESTEFKGEGLKIGGEGMKGFYDKMLPSFMNKYGKKWGVKVEDLELPNLGKSGRTMHSVPVTEEMKASVMEGQVMFRTIAITPEVQEEMDAISASAIVRGNYLKAPNGADTNLTPEQWAMVRTKAFKAWFGDWEKAARINKLRNSEPVVMTGNEFEGKYELNRESAQKYILDELRDTYTISDTKERIKIVKKGAKKVTSHSMGNDAHMRSIAIIPEIIKSAIFITEMPADKADSQYDSYRYYVCGLEYAGESYTVKMTVGVKNGDYYYDHTLTDIEKGKLLDMIESQQGVSREGFTPTENESEPSYALSDIKDKKLVSILQTNSSKVVDANGEPKVVFHGGNWRPILEEPGKAIFKMRSGLMGRGAYFTDNFTTAADFAREKYEWENNKEVDEDFVYDNGYITEAFLNIRNEDNIREYYGETYYLATDPNQIKSATDNTGEFSEENEDVRFSIRTKPAPKKTGVGYKVFYLKNGKLYPPMVANQGGVDTPMGVWLDAEEGTRAGVSKTGRPKVKQGGKGTQGGSGTLAYRPGWHLGEIPYAIQFNRKDENGDRTLFPADFVWAKVEYANDVDYQKEAMSYGMNANGKFQHSLAGLPKLPTDGSYRYRTNPNPETDPWIITGAMKVNRLLTPSEVDQMVVDAGREPQRRQEGAVTDEQIKALNESLNTVRFSVRENLTEEEKANALQAIDQRIAEVHQNKEMSPKSNPVGNPAEPLNNEYSPATAGAQGASLTAKQAKKLVNRNYMMENLADFIVDFPEDITLENFAKRLFEGLGLKANEQESDYVHYLSANKAPETIRLSNHSGNARNIIVRGVKTSRGYSIVIRLDDNYDESKKSNHLDANKWADVDEFVYIAPDRQRMQEIAKTLFNLLDVDEYVDLAKAEKHYISPKQASDNVPYRVIGTPTEDVVAEGVNLSKKELANLAGDIFAALPEESRKKITDSLNGNLLGLQDAIMQIPVDLATKENWNDEDKDVAAVIRAAIQDLVDANPTSRPLTTKEALWMLYNSTNTVKDLVDAASRAFVAHRLGFDPASMQRKQEVDNYVRFRTAANSAIDAATDMYNYETSLWTERLKESWLDMNQSVVSLQNALETASNMAIEPWENIVFALNRLSSKSYADKKKYMRDFLVPMWDAVMQIVKADGKSIEEIERYMMLKHGLERNKKFASRDAKEFYRSMYDMVAERMKNQSHAQQVVALSEANKALADIRAKMANATGQKLADLQEAEKKAMLDVQIADLVLRGDEKQNEAELLAYYDAIDNEADPKYREFREKDYGGLTSMFVDTTEVKRSNYKSEEAYQKAVLAATTPKFDKVADMEAEAQAEVDVFENVVAVKNLWDKVDAATKETLRHQYESGMITLEQYEAVRDMFEFYVPLRGFADNTAEDMYSYYMNNSAGGFAKPILAAKGRKTRAESPLGWIGTMAESAIQADNKNEAKMTLYYAILRRPDQNLLTVTETWYEYTGQKDANGKKIFKAAYPPATSQALSADDLRQHMDTWEADMKNKQSRGEAYKGSQKVNLKGSVIFQEEKEEKEHIVRVKVAGKDYSILVNGNPRAAQAINGLLNPDANVGPVAQWIGNVRRNLSALLTSYSPLFWVANFQRDLLASTMRVSEADGWNQAMKYLANRRHAWRVASYVYKYDAGELGNSYYENLYREFAENGGITGYTSLTTNKEYEKLLEDYAKNVDRKALNAVKGAFDKFMGFGEAIEQVTRFAAYITAREAGKSIEEAVYAAKEVSVNFNRKGSAKPISLDELEKLRTKDGKKLNMAQKTAALVLSAMPGPMKIAYYFVNASIQALSSSAKLAKKSPGIAATWVGMYMGTSIALAMINYLLSDDDDDEYLNLPDYLRHSTLLVKVADGYYFKWSLPQEMRPFYAWADILVRKMMGKSKHKSGFEVGKEIALTASQWLPVNPFEAEDPPLSLMPDFASPLAELKANQNAFGGKIYDDMPYKSEGVVKEIPAYRKATERTGAVYVDIAEFLNNVSGGNEVEKGAININPAMVEHLVEGYGGGIYDFAKLMVSVPSMIFGDEPVEVKKIPFVNKVILSADETNMYSHTNEAFYHYRDVADNAKRVEKEYRESDDPSRADAYRNEEDWRIYLLYKQYEQDFKDVKEKLDNAVDKEEEDLLKQEQNVLREMFLDDIAKGDIPEVTFQIREDVKRFDKEIKAIMKPVTEANKERLERKNAGDIDGMLKAIERRDSLKDTPEYKRAEELNADLKVIKQQLKELGTVTKGIQRDSVVGELQKNYDALVRKMIKEISEL